MHSWLAPSYALDATPPHEWEAAADDELALLAERTAGWGEKYPDVDVVHQSVCGNPAAVLVAASEGAGLTVVGTRGPGALSGLLLGSVGHAVLHHARSPVAVVRLDTSRDEH